jgi:hypothetical protein
LFRTIAITCFALALPLLGISAAPPSAEEVYARAVAQMQRHPKPAFATYRALVSGLNCSVKGGFIACTLARSTAESPFFVDLRVGDGRTALRKESASVVLGDSTFLNASWPGIETLIRHGFTGAGSSPSSTPLPSPPLPVQAPSALPVIAVVSALAVTNYNVYDAGAAACANGNAGHAVRLVARRDPLRYPLTGATIDLTTGNLCAVRFNAKIAAAAGLVGATGGAQLDIENVFGYEVVTNERFDIDLRAIGIAVKHISIGVTYSDFSFPEAINPEVFATPSPPPVRSSR